MALYVDAGTSQCLLHIVVRRLQEVLLSEGLLLLALHSSIVEQVLRGGLAPTPPSLLRTAQPAHEGSMNAVDRQGEALPPVLELLLQEVLRLRGVVREVKQVAPAGSRGLGHLAEEGLRMVAKPAELLDCKRDEAMHAPEWPRGVLVLSELVDLRLPRSSSRGRRVEPPRLVGSSHMREHSRDRHIQADVSEGASVVDDGDISAGRVPSGLRLGTSFLRSLPKPASSMMVLRTPTAALCAAQ